MRSTRKTNDRTITTTFYIDGTEGEKRGRATIKALTLTTSHNKSRKQYRSRAGRIVTDGSFVTETLGWQDAPAPLPTATTPTARYSASALEDAHTDFESRAADSTTFASLIEWAKEARA